MMRVFIFLYSIYGASECNSFEITAERGFILATFENIPFENYIETSENREKIISEITIINNISPEAVDLLSYELTPFFNKKKDCLCYFFTYKMTTNEILNYIMFLEVCLIKDNDIMDVLLKFEPFLIKKNEQGFLVSETKNEVSETYKIYNEYTYKFLNLIFLARMKTQNYDFLDVIIQELQKLKDYPHREVALSIFNFIKSSKDQIWQSEIYKSIKFRIIFSFFEYINPNSPMTEINLIQNPFLHLNTIGFVFFCKKFYFVIEQICLINRFIDFIISYEGEKMKVEEIETEEKEEKCKTVVDLPKIYFYRNIILTSGLLNEYELEDIQLIFVKYGKDVNFEGEINKDGCHILLDCENLNDTKDLYVYVCIKGKYISNPIEIDSVL